MKHDANSHWQQCSICGTMKDVEAHTMGNNGGTKTNHDNSHGTSYREICTTCGYQTGPLIILHGRRENYENATRYYTDSMRGVSLFDNTLLHITEAQFHEWYAENSCGVIYYPDGSESHVDYILMNESGEETFEMYAEMCNQAYNLFDSYRDIPEYNSACIKLSWLETLFMNLASEDKERNEEAVS